MVVALTSFTLGKNRGKIIWVYNVLVHSRSHRPVRKIDTAIDIYVWLLKYALLT